MLFSVVNAISIEWIRKEYNLRKLDSRDNNWHDDGDHFTSTHP